MGDLVGGSRPEAEVIYAWSGRRLLNRNWKTELVKVENFSDELCVGAKD
jgi:hypothetical protein